MNAISYVATAVALSAVVMAVAMTWSRNIPRNHYPQENEYDQEKGR